MKILFVACLFGLVGCSGPALMRCPEKAPESMMLCPEHVDGVYYKCKKEEIRRCEIAQ